MFVGQARWLYLVVVVEGVGGAALGLRKVLVEVGRTRALRITAITAPTD